MKKPTETEWKVSCKLATCTGTVFVLAASVADARAKAKKTFGTSLIRITKTTRTKKKP